MWIPLIIVALLASSTLSLPSNDQQQLIEKLQAELEALKNENENLRSLNENLQKKSGGLELIGTRSDEEEYGYLKRFKDLPVPRLTKNMEPSEWFPLFEQQHPPAVLDELKTSLFYYVDSEVVECNLAALQLEYNEMKSSLKKCN